MTSDVRDSSGGSSSSSSSSKSRDHHHDCDDDDDSILGDLIGALLCEMFSSSSDGGYSSSSSTPSPTYFFSRYPYADGSGFLTREPIKTFSGRVRFDYATDFDDLERVGGHLLLSTFSGWGLDTEMNRLEERLPGGAHDDLWLGDVNVIYRFSEDEHVVWRAGLGMNWLDDPLDTDFGFNFTLGLDVFPAEPWVVSAEIDWGTLGDAEQFRLRTTAGVVLWRLESYVGYEYYDLDRTQLNTLIGGVRFWF